MKPLKIGNFVLKNRLFLSPMVDVTDLAYRLVCRKAGVGMAYTEMLYVDAILHENIKTKKLMKTSSEDSPIGLQVTGNSFKEFEKFSRLKKIRKFELIDINCGCPSTRIVGNSAGSYLMSEPEKIGKIVGVLKDNGFNVTAKIRLGFDKNNALSVAKTVERAGADMITVHGRLATQNNKVPAGWKEIKKVKENVGIPVVGNGDVFTGKDAERMFKETGCDGIMIARAAIGNPLIFKEILHYLKTGGVKDFSFQEKIKLLREYLELAEKYEIIDMQRIKYLGVNFFKGFKGSAQKREEFVRMKSFEEIKNFVRNF